MAVVAAFVGSATAFFLPRFFDDKSTLFRVSEPPTLFRNRDESQKTDDTRDQLVVSGSYDGHQRVMIISWNEGAPNGPYFVSYDTRFGETGSSDEFIARTIVAHPTPRALQIEAVAVRAPPGVLANPIDYEQELRKNGPRSTYIAEKAGPFVWRPPAE